MASVVTMASQVAARVESGQQGIPSGHWETGPWQEPTRRGKSVRSGQRSDRYLTRLCLPAWKNSIQLPKGCPPRRGDKGGPTRFQAVALTGEPIKSGRHSVRRSCCSFPVFSNPLARFRPLSSALFIVQSFIACSCVLSRASATDSFI